MKRSFILTFLFGLVLFFSACSGCTSKEEPVVTDPDTTIVVNKIIKEDFDSMFNKYGKEEFRFYETDILLKNFLDEENDGDIAELVNIYQVVTELDSTSFDTYVYKVQHFSNGTVLKDSINGFWIENEPIILDEIKVSYDSACAIIASVNYPKPHSKHVTLRKPLGIVNCNPQWVFGNIHEQIWVDATTGEAKKSNPAFPEDFEYAFNW